MQVRTSLLRDLRRRGPLDHRAGATLLETRNGKIDGDPRAGIVRLWGREGFRARRRNERAQHGRQSCYILRANGDPARCARHDGYMEVGLSDWRCQPRARVSGIVALASRHLRTRLSMLSRCAPRLPRCFHPILQCAVVLNELNVVSNGPEELWRGCGETQKCTNGRTELGEDMHLRDRNGRK